MKNARCIALLMMTVVGFLAPGEALTAELWLGCGPMAIGGRCKTEGGLVFYNDVREKQSSSEVTCYDQTYKVLMSYECFPLTEPSDLAGRDLRVLCSSKSSSIDLSRDEYNDEYKRCRRLCGNCRYGNWR